MAFPPVLHVVLRLIMLSESSDSTEEMRGEFQLSVEFLFLNTHLYMFGKGSYKKICMSLII